MDDDGGLVSYEMSTLFSRKGYTDGRLTEVAAYHRDPLLHIEREVNQVQQSLQVLIDAQSEGLLAGLASSGNSDAKVSSDGGARSPPSASVPEVRQPGIRSKIGLRAAREGILKYMEDLVRLREEQQETIGSQINERRGALDEIDNFTSKRTDLNKSISAIQNGRDAERSRELRDEARNVETEIHELETRLYELKARRRHVVDEISLHENAVEANLSSYKTSLSLVESNIERYLCSLPIDHLPSISNDAAFYALNPKRRTLEMASTQWKEEEAELEDRRHQVGLEVSALGEGFEVWRQVILQVSGFEKRLKADMRRLMRAQSENSRTSRGGDFSARRILGYLRETTEFVSGKLDLAQRKGWNLLVCCIGAELEALEEAYDMLVDTFNDDEESDSEERQNAAAAAPEAPDEKPTKEEEEEEEEVDNSDPPDDLLRDADAHSHDHDDHEREPVFREEDNEPDPAWLLPET